MNNTIETRLILAAAASLWFGGCLNAADSAIITDSGSTNSDGFRIEVSQSGKAVYASKSRRAGFDSATAAKPTTRKIPSALRKRFFTDLAASEPFPALPNQGCMKSASFGTTMTIEYQGQTTPDLRCGDRGNAKLKMLIQDSNEIVQLFRRE